MWTVLAQTLGCQVSDLKAAAQNKLINVVTMFRERPAGNHQSHPPPTITSGPAHHTLQTRPPESSILNTLAVPETECPQEAPTAHRHSLHHLPLNSHLELKQVHMLPVTAMESQSVPCLGGGRGEEEEGGGEGGNTTSRLSPLMQWVNNFSLHTFETCAHRHSDTTSKKENILRERERERERERA